jgi:hypothetical protein
MIEMESRKKGELRRAIQGREKKEKKCTRQDRMHGTAPSIEGYIGISPRQMGRDKKNQTRERDSN